MHKWWKENGYIFSFFILALTIRIIWVLQTNCALEGDANSRIGTIFMWNRFFTQLPRLFPLSILNPSLDWLPLHFYLNGLLTKLTNEYTYSPRLLSALVGAATVFPLYRLTAYKFNLTAAKIAVALFTFYGAHILLSAQVMSEPFYLFFVICSLYFFEKSLRLQQSKHLTLLGISLLCLTLLRYEGWVFTALLLFLLTISGKFNWLSLLKLTAIATFGMAAIMVVEHFQGQHPLRGILYSDQEVTLFFNGHGRNLSSQFLSLRYAFIPFYFFSGLYFLFLYRKENVRFLLNSWLPYFLPALPFLIKLCNFTITPQYRYAMLYMVPVLPFIAFFISEVLAFLKVRPVGTALLLFLFIGTMNYPLFNRLQSGEDVLTYPSGFLESAKFARTQITSATFYLDYGGNNNFNYWGVQSEILTHVPPPQAQIDSIVKAWKITPAETEFINNSFKKSIRYALDEPFTYGQSWSVAGFEAMVRKKEITHLLLFPNGVVNKDLQLSKPTEERLGATFYKLFEKNGYVIYKIDYPAFR